MVAKAIRVLVLAIAAVAAAGCSCGIDAGRLGSIECETENDCLDGEVCEGGYCQYEGAGGDGDSDTDADADGDGDADCPRGEVSCGDGCFDLSSDDGHCGRCDRSCDGDESCNDGQCEGSSRCDPGLVFCEAVESCVDLSTDIDHCGGCGDGCGDGELCVAGNCAPCEPGVGGCPAATCPEGETDCDDGPGTDCRVVDGRDARNCGGCGVTCGAEEQCDGGQCSCRIGLTDECGGGCVSLATDPGNCGACGAPCADFCQGGHCVEGCSDGNRECDGYCTDTDSDPLNCGDCGDACAADRLCIDGECRSFRVPLACDACPCDGCSGDFGQCCTYPGGAIPVCVDADGCP